MHELSTAQSLLETILEVAKQKGAKRITMVYLEIGELTFLNPEQLKFAFETISQSTLAENSGLTIIEKKGHYKCECGSEGELPRVEGMHSVPAFYCPDCGGSVKISSGKQCFVQSVDMDL